MVGSLEGWIRGEWKDTGWMYTEWVKTDWTQDE